MFENRSPFSEAKQLMHAHDITDGMNNTASSSLLLAHKMERDLRMKFVITFFRKVKI